MKIDLVTGDDEPPSGASSPSPTALRPPASIEAFDHRHLDDDEFWRLIPAFRNVDKDTFLDWRWQNRNCITSSKDLRATLGDLVPEEFYRDVEQGLARAPMTVRLTPYVVARIDWNNRDRDPVRRQFLTIGSQLRADHPMAQLDSLHEQEHSPVPGLVHRYTDKALFLTLDTCPVYCRFCTRSYSVGLDTQKVEKLSIGVNRLRWERAFEYVRSRPEVEDIVISGGDTFQLKPDQVRLIGHTLLDIPHVRRMRFATKGPAVLPMKLLSHHEWVEALIEVHRRARKLHKEVCIHTHFAHPNEITGITRDGMNRLFEEGLTVRNQAVVMRGVNDDAATLRTLVKRLSFVNIHPYYLYQHDFVPGVEDLRTALSATAELERNVRGATAGFNTPTFVIDVPGGGGKRDVHSFDHYDRTTGVAVYRSPNVDADALYLHFDPIHLLPAEGQARWSVRGEHGAIVEEAIAQVRPGRRAQNLFAPAMLDRALSHA
ncbi:MAG: KamA family radical SAM protein [Deltaproteobacteria bacterium]|nr:KamA family radical SAM protein [Deltaproteobacteria bacterium]